MNDHDRVINLIQTFNNFRIASQDGITVEGSLHTGYAIDTSNLGAGVTGGTGGTLPPPPPPPPILTGACCIGGVCSIQTATNCSILGGIYQGNGTVCVPNPCPLPPCN